MGSLATDPMGSRAVLFGDSLPDGAGAALAAGGEAVMKSVETHPGVRHLVSITPYRREGASDCGLVVTILDISALRRGERVSGKRKASA